MNRPNPAPRRSRKAEQAAVTRRALLDVARELFTRRGYAATGTEEIVAQAGMTMGALYYHFRDKRDLFRAVFEELAAEFDQACCPASAAAGDQWDAFVAACLATVEAARRQDIRQVYLLDAPSVLGPELLHEVDDRLWTNTMVSRLRALMAAEAIEDEPAEPLAALLAGALHECGLRVASAGEDEHARQMILAGLERFLDRLRRRSPETASPL